jgi:hypothetical protein
MPASDHVKQSCKLHSVFLQCATIGLMLQSPKTNRYRPRCFSNWNSGKWMHLLPRILRALAFIFICCVRGAHGQALTARISVLSLDAARLKIEGTREYGTREWSFRNTYAGINNLGERIEKLDLADAMGAQIEARKLAPGEYEAAREAVRFSYEVNLKAPPNDADAAYVSWLTQTRGVLMLGDLLPRLTNEKETSPAKTTVVQFELPAQWRIISVENRRAGNVFETKDATRAVFYAGSDLREQERRIGAMSFTFVTAGDWAFPDEEAERMAEDLLREHMETNGGAPRAAAMLALLPFPRFVAASRWSAETRGGTTMLLLGRSPSKIAALAQLSVPLAHELFHLWVPNGLALDGNYDWFYEGFTQYQALRAVVRLHLLTFDDYLNAIGRAFDVYAATGDKDKLSLLEASARRWTSAPSLVYNKGLLVAFLYDLAVRQQTSSKQSLDDAYRELFRLYHAPEARMDGNAAVIKTLCEARNMQDFARVYIENARAIDLQAALASYGLKAERAAARTRITAVDSLSRPQRDLLRKLGYNNAVRSAAPRVR